MGPCPTTSASCPGGAPAAVSLLTLGGREVIPLRLGAYQEARLDRRQGQADLVLRDGVFFLYATLDVPEAAPGDPAPEAYLGLDLGIVNLSVDSDGTSTAGPPWTGGAGARPPPAQPPAEAHPQRPSQAPAPQAGPGPRPAPHQPHDQQARRRRRQGTARGIALEDLRGIRARTGTVARRQRARHANWSFSQLRAFVEYKARLAGVPVVAVDPRHTSQTCPASAGGAGNRRDRNTFLCLGCGRAGPADHITALNISRRGVLVARAAVSHRVL